MCYYVRTRYDTEDLHVLDVRATTLQQALETDIYSLKQISSLRSIV